MNIIEAIKSKKLFTNNIKIEVHSASFRSIRGRSVVACLFDKIAFCGEKMELENMAEVKKNNSNVVCSFTQVTVGHCKGQPG